MKKLILILTIVFCLMSCTDSSQGDDTVNSEVTNDVVSTVIEGPAVDAVTADKEVPQKEEAVVVNLGGIASKLPVDKYSSKYDEHFKKYNKRFFGVCALDYRWFKSQALSESALNPNAVSPVNASGILQIMPATWKEISSAIDIGNDPFNARYNICAGIYYDKRMWNIWKSKRSVLDRLALSFGSYNAGAGNLIKSQKLCIAAGDENCNTWAGVRTHAHEVSSWKDIETKGYIKRIFGYMGMKGW